MNGIPREFLLLLIVAVLIGTLRVLWRDGIAGLRPSLTGLAATFLPRLPNVRHEPAKPVATSTASPASIASPGAFHLLPYVNWHAMTECVPHVAIHGPTGAGKTVMAQALTADRPGHVLIIDPNWEPGAWGGLPVITTTDTDDFAPVEIALTALLSEMSRRAAAFKRGETSDALTIIWDEVPECVEMCPSAGEVLRRLARRARKYQMRLVILTQSNRVKALGLEGQGDALDNFCWLTLGDAAREVAQGLISRKLASADLVADFIKLPHPALIEYRGKHKAIETSGLLDLAKRPIDPSRCFVLPETKPQQPETVSAPETPVETSFQGIEMPQSTSADDVSDPFRNVDFSGYARLIQAGLITETKLLETAIGVKPGGSKAYKAAQAKLKAALTAVE